MSLSSDWGTKPRQFDHDQERPGVAFSLSIFDHWPARRNPKTVFGIELMESNIKFDYVRQVGSLSQQSLLSFYENLAYYLTISIRAIWSDKGLNDSQKVESMKWINEVMHKVVQKIIYLRMDCNEYSEADTWDMMKHYMSLCPDISGHIGYATIRSYEAVDKPGSAA